MDLNSGRGIHAFFGHLTSGVEPVPGMECLTLMRFDQYGTVHLLHLFLYVQVIPYYTDWHWGASLGAPSPSDGSPDQRLYSVARRLRCTADGASHACGGSPPNFLVVDTIKEGEEAPEGRPRPCLQGADLLAPRRRIVPHSTRHQHCRGLLSSILSVRHPSAALWLDDLQATTCLHGRSVRGLRGPGLNILQFCHTC